MKNEKVKSFGFLLSKTCDGLSGKKRIMYFIYNFSIIAVFLALLTTLSLLLAPGPGYSMAIVKGYFASPLIFLLNYIPVAAIFVVLYTFVGKVWLSFAIDGLIVLGFSVANFFLLKFRDDPLMFSDVLYIREAAQISEEGYNYTPSTLMVAVAVAFVLLTVALFFLCRACFKFDRRFFSLIVVVSLSFVVKDVYFSEKVYTEYTTNKDNINEWSPTQVYISKGFVYPFVHSMSELFDVVPEDYSEDYVKDILSEYETAVIPENKKVNVICIMLEAFCDLETLGIENIDQRAYNQYRYLRSCGHSGTLVTNIFAGGTIDTERAFLTGLTALEHCRRNTNSYAHFFNNNGYYTDGSHPGENWFYNRKNVNKYLGFDEYRFAEDHFEDKYGDNMRYDYVVIDDIYDMYVNHIENSTKPYFGFHVTYQGHGPYRSDVREWGTDVNPLYVNDKISQESQNIINNYLGSVYITSAQVVNFYEKIKMLDEPTVIVVFGDHKPWLGDGNSVYNELSVNIDVSTMEGFLNYYSTEYIILANDSAKEKLGKEFHSYGPVVGSQFLMNEVFSQMGILGDEYMQYTDDVRKTIIAANGVALITNDKKIYAIDDLPRDIQKLYDEYKWVEYYHRTNFKY